MKKPKKETVVESVTEEVKETLSKEEKQRLLEFENKIETSQKNYIAVGEALTGIQTGNLYKETHKSFDNYCDEKWGFSGSHARRLMDSYEFIQKLRSAEKNPVKDEDLPRNEFQARLVMEKREKKHWVRTWNKILKQAKNDARKISASLIDEILEGKPDTKVSVKPDRKESKGITKVVPKALKLINEARDDLNHDRERDWGKFLDELEQLLKVA